RHHTRHGNHSGNPYYWHTRRRQRQRPAHLEPGRPRPATSIRDVSAFAFYQFQKQDGHMETRLVSVVRWLDERHHHHSDGCLWPARIAQISLAHHCRWLNEASSYV